jgi:hypothetical protein
LLEVGSFIVTLEDEVANFPWRRKLKHRDNTNKPMTHDDEKYPEAWRVPAPPKTMPQLCFKTVCRILELQVTNGPKGHAYNHPLAPGDVAIKVQVFVRPSDIGELHKCPFEVIETNQGKMHDFTNCFPYLIYLYIWFARNVFWCII